MTIKNNKKIPELSFRIQDHLAHYMNDIMQISSLDAMDIIAAIIAALTNELASTVAFLGSYTDNKKAREGLMEGTVNTLKKAITREMNRKKEYKDNGYN